MFLTSMLGAGIFKTIALIFEYTAGIIIGVFKFLLFMPMYLIFAGVMLIATFAEMTFKKLAGIDTIYLNGEAFGGGSGDGKDLVYAFITDSAVQDVFWAIVGLSIVLLFVFTIVAMIKSEFTIDLKGSAKGPIISRALKSLVNLLVVPVVTLISIFGTNFLTKTIYDLFTPAGTSVVTKCFHVGAYNANRARCDPLFAEVIRNNGIIASGNPFAGINDDNDLAKAIDDYFINYQDFRIEYKQYGFIDLLEAVDDKTLSEGSIDALFFGIPKEQIFFTLFQMSQVNIYYNMAKFDWILAIGSGIVITWTLLSVCLVLVKRVFELAILFLLAPPMIAIAPLDGGQAEKKWRGEFMKRLLSVIGPIFAYNMYFLMIPLFENISLFEGIKMAVGTNTAVSGVSMLGSYQLAITDFLIIFDIFFQLICVIVGLGILKSASALLSNLLGVEDLVKSGGEAAKKAVDVGKKAALGATSIGVGAIKGAVGTAKKIKAGREAKKNAKETAADREKAKSELEPAKEEFEKSEQETQKNKALVSKMDDMIEKEKGSLAADEGYQKDKQFLADNEGKKLTGAKKEAYDKIKARVEGKEAASQQKLTHYESMKAQATKKYEASAKDTQEKEQAYLERQQGISSEKSAELKALRSETDANGKPKTKEQLLADQDKAAAYEQKLGNIDPKAARERAWESEFGQDAHETSFFAKVLGEGSKFSKSKLGKSLFGKSLEQMFNPEDHTAYKRRINDGLAGMFGDGGGGDLWKIYFNKNARAGLYEGVPESKKRSAGIEQELSWTARDKYYDKKAEQDKRKEEEKIIRRMLGESLSGTMGANYRDAYKQIESGNASPAQIKKLEAKIEKMELESGIRQQARDFYDAATPGSEKAKQLQAYKEQMQEDATKKALRDEAINKERIARAAEANGQTVETKITEQSAEQVAKAIERALSTGKGLKLADNSKGLKINAEGAFNNLKVSLDNINNGIASLAEAIKQLNGGDNKKK